MIKNSPSIASSQAGFKSYWFSRQGQIGAYETAITGIANRADEKNWISDNYDGGLVDYLKSAMTTSHKKLIVLHTYGSHLSACNQYPKEDTVFKDGLYEYEDCYDNSILYTDKLLNNIFDVLKDQKASVLYFSDHAQLRRVKRGDVDYVHGSIAPSKESLEVPQFIWYSNNVPQAVHKVGHYQPLYPTANNYNLVANWLGIKSIDGKNITSPLHDDFVPSHDKILIMNTQLEVLDYQNLPSDLSAQ